MSWGHAPAAPAAKGHAHTRACAKLCVALPQVASPNLVWRSHTCFPKNNVWRSQAVKAEGSGTIKRAHAAAAASIARYASAKRRAWLVGEALSMYGVAIKSSDVSAGHTWESVWCVELCGVASMPFNVDETICCGACICVCACICVGAHMRQKQRVQHKNAWGMVPGLRSR